MSGKVERYGYGRLEYSAEQGAFHIEPEGGPIATAQTKDRWLVLAMRMQINILEDFSNYALSIMKAEKPFSEGSMVYAFHVWIHEDCCTLPNKRK